MLIHPLPPKFENGELCVSARIELEKPPFNVPEILWFKFPETFAHLVSDNADGFAVALMSLAMYRGENIRVRGTVSPALMYGMAESQRVQNYRKPHRYHPIQVQADAYARRTPGESKAATTFSGGFDSFYTVWSHLPQNEKLNGNELSYAIFVQGFDIGLEDKGTFETCRSAYAKLMADWGIELVPVKTNVRAFDKPENWVSSSTFATIAIGHLMGRGVSRYYVPANDFYIDFPEGAVSSLAEWVLSSESVQVIDDGAQLTKFEKIIALANVAPVYDHLRVCWGKPDGLLNCCECRKCINTMTALELAGTLQNFKTFPKPLDGNKRRFSSISYPSRQIYQDYFNRAVQLKRYDLALDMGIKLSLNYVRWSFNWLRRTMSISKPPSVGADELKTPYQSSARAT